MVSDDMVSDDMVSDDIVSDDMVSDDIVSDDIVSDDIVSDDMVSDDIVSDDMVSDDTVSDDMVSDDTVSDDMVSDDIILDDMVSDDIILDDMVSDDVVLNDDLNLNNTDSQLEKRHSIIEENTNLLDFDLPKNMSSVIKVIGVGGGGSNAVNHMINEGIKGVDFMICNTDAQALEKGKAAIKIQLGMSLTEGLGAGENPSVGEQAAVESEKAIRSVLEKNTKMVFVTAGMGGGTGTGAAPVIAQICKELDILTIGIVTVPFGFEGPKRFKQAQDGIDKMRKYVDSLVVINNDKLVEVYGDLGLRSGFAKADETLMVAARGISEVITKNCLVNIDLNDAKTVLKDSGTAIMGYGKASGADRAEKALERALDSPLLNDNHIKGASKILLLILSGKDELTINEHAEINQYLQREAGGQANIILGVGDDSSLDEDISITIIATGVLTHNVNPATGCEERTVHRLEDNVNKNDHNDLNDSSNNLKKSQNEDKVNKKEYLKEEMNNTIDFALNNTSEVDNNLQSKNFHKSSTLKQDITSANMSTLSEKNVQLAKERKNRLKKFHNLNFNNQVVLKELEEEPAYKRQGLDLDEIQHSSKDSNSRIVLDSSSEDLEIKNSNSFLHDNVD